MHNGWFTSIIIPAKNEEDYISDVITNIPDWIDLILVVDDGSTDNTSDIAKKSLDNMGRDDFENGSSGPWSSLLRLKGEGVGNAIMKGYQYILTSKNKQHQEYYLKHKSASIVMAGDGQMDPKDLAKLLEPIISGETRYSKGNRFAENMQIHNMPLKRRIGSKLLSTLTRLASGITVKDPQCGYTAVNLSIFEEINIENPWKGYGYPNWILLKLGTNSENVKEIPTKCIYRDEKSGIKLWSFLPLVAAMLFIGLWKRGTKWYILGQGVSRSRWYVRTFMISSWFSIWSTLLVLLVTKIDYPINIKKPVLILQMILGIYLCYIVDRYEVHRKLKS